MMSWGMWLPVVVWCMLLSVGCSTLQNDLPSTVQSLDTAACETCHPLLPQTEAHFEHVIDTESTDISVQKLLPLRCRECHRGYDDTLGWKEPSLHLNGRIDTLGEECTYCHEYLKDCGWCHALPPLGEGKQQKVHKHVTERNFPCDICHKGYDNVNRTAPRATHGNGRVDVVFRTDTLQKKGAPTTPHFSGDSCYNLYCHGALTPGGRNAVAIDDVQLTGPQECDFCHNTGQLQLAKEDHYREGHAELYHDCLNCHKNFSYTLQLAVDSLHFNGIIDTSRADMCNACHYPPIP